VSEAIAYRIQFKYPGTQWRELMRQQYTEYEREEAVEKTAELNKGRTRGYQYRLIDARGNVIYG
jgi:hypothetical protein